MARYIKSNILFQAYVHIEAPFEELENSPHIESMLDDFVTKRAQHFLYPAVDIDLEFKEGSIKTYATVRGTLRQCLRENYESFSQEIENLYWFARRLSDASNMEVAFLTGAMLRSIERTEARPGIIGQTKRIIDGILSFRPVDNERSAGHLIRRVRVTRIDAENLLKNLIDEEDRNLVKKELKVLLKEAPTKISKEKIFDEKLEFSYEDGLKKFKELVK